MTNRQIAAIAEMKLQTERHEDLGQTEEEFIAEVLDEVNGFLHWPVKP